MSAELQAAIDQRWREYRAAIDRLQELSEERETECERCHGSGTVGLVTRRSGCDLCDGSGRSEKVDPGNFRLLKECAELSQVLRRALKELTPEQVYRAFGAPGDFGYETPIGDALSRLYRGEQ